MDYEEPDEDPAPQPEPRVRASERGSDAMGFTGTVTRHDVTAAGLTTLTGDTFDDRPVTPMLPGTWDGDENPAPSPDDPEGGPRR